MFKNDIIVRFNECDALGHVNNATYFTYFEEARTELFRLFNPELDTNSWNLIVASTYCDFLREVAYASKITVYTWISRLGNSSFEVEHAIQDHQKNWVARGKATLLGFDFNQKKAIPLTEEIRDALLQHTEGPENVPDLRN
ncbi:acyl-CoA thioesterase [Risungbinella massiliensis]|uniref:acyl-CoA thioesterase n=1 Tax=Risungbinella massiliensis TaxID=1329796 RepID=UPI0005CC02F9|nr:thioesterase family protein [Risungbinella massiliensis]